jgi:hypothetical protein
MMEGEWEAILVHQKFSTAEHQGWRIKADIKKKETVAAMIADATEARTDSVVGGSQTSTKSVNRLRSTSPIPSIFAGTR